MWGRVEGYLLEGENSENRMDKPFTSKPIDCHCPVSPRDSTDFPLSPPFMNRA